MTRPGLKDLILAPSMSDGNKLTGCARSRAGDGDTVPEQPVIPGCRGVALFSALWTDGSTQDLLVPLKVAFGHMICLAHAMGWKG